MKMTVSKIVELLKTHAEKKKETLSDVDSAKKRIETLDRELREAYEAADSNTYYEKLQEKQKAEAELTVKTGFLERIEHDNPVSLANAVEAWNNYVSGYNSKLDKAMSAFKAKRDELNAMYSDMLDLQNEACKTRELLAKSAGGFDKVDTFKMNHLPYIEDTVFALDMYGAIQLRGCSCLDPDAVYYLACYEQKHNVKLGTLMNHDDERIRVQSIVGRQRSI